MIVFTGGIGENSARIRSTVCADMQWAGIELNPICNSAVDGETRISSDKSAVAVHVIPTNEEIIVARQTAVALNKKKPGF